MALDVALIKELFSALDAQLAKRSVVGEIGICGGAVMCLVFQARQATKDIDAIFEPTEEIRAAARTVALDYGLREDWLNDSAKGFFHADPPRDDVWQGANLRVWSPSGDYMLAMKCISARFDGHDRDDVAFLIHHLRLASPIEVFEIITRYYPRQLIPAKTQFLVEELFESE